MPASVNDKITETANGGRPVVAKVTGTRAGGGATLACDALTYWPTNTAVHFATYKVDTSNKKIGSTQIDWKGIVSGTNLTSLTLQAGTDNGNAVGDYVEMTPTASWGQDLATALEVGHNNDGTHKAGATYDLPVFRDTTTPTKQADLSLSGATASTKTTLTFVQTANRAVTFQDTSYVVAGRDTTETLTNKRITQRVGTVADAATITPTGDSSDMYTVTALAQAATIAAPSGTPTNGQKLILRLKDNGTGRALTWNSIYRAVGVTLPTTTVASKTHYIGLIYNDAATKWDAVAVLQEA